MSAPGKKERTVAKGRCCVLQHLSDGPDAVLDLLAGQIATLLDASVTAVVFDGSSIPQNIRARQAFLRDLVADAAVRAVPPIILELVDSSRQSDLRTLYAAAREFDCPDLTYAHLRAHEELLLCIPDAIAWAWAKGSSWRRLVSPMVTDIRQI